MEPRLKKRKSADVLRLGRGPFATQSVISELCRDLKRYPHTIVGASVLTTVLPELARWLPVAAAASMCQTCQQWLPALDATRARIADTVARLVSLQGPLSSTLLQAGVSSGDVLATRAQAWRWLDQCQHMLNSAECWQLVALALLRLSAKFIMAPEHADICLRFLPKWPGLHSTECRLAIALWTRRNNQAPHYRRFAPRSRRWRRGLLREKPDAGAAACALQALAPRPSRRWRGGLLQ